ncbi:glycosyltransferase [Deferribacter thermophilus]|uniref:glycosyltransferase family 2 protein n=1 Tax=Deferribacter thermophilus TaxID=53573 RepID=UPI003C1915FF
MVSVIIPVKDRIDSLKDAIESVLWQTYKNFEIIIIDDGSSIDIKKELTPYLNLIKFIKLENNLGVSAARNTGIKAAKGEFIAFLDSDDLWLPKKLEMQLNYMEKEGVEVCHTNEFWYKKGKFINQGKKHEKFGGHILLKILDHCRISPSSFIAKKTVFEKVGYFDEHLKIAEDYDLWLRVSLFYKIGYLKTPLIVKRFFLNDHLSTHEKHIEFYRLLSLAKFLNRYNKYLDLKAKREIMHTLNYKFKIVSQGINKSIEKF